MTTLAEIDAAIARKSQPQPSVDVATPSLADIDAAIAKRQPQPEMGMIDTAMGYAGQAGDAISEAFTGSERETRATRELPEMGLSGILNGEDPAIVARLAPVLLTTIDPQEIATIVSKALPHIGVQQDEKGNFLLGNNRTGVKTVINKPGFSTMDAMQVGALGAAYTPAAKLASMGSGAMANMTKVGFGSGATEAVIQGAQAASGGGFDTADVGIAAAGGGAFQGLFQGLSKYFPMFRESIQRTGGKINDTIRDTFKAEARIKGIPSESITDDMIAREISGGKQLADEVEFGVELTKGGRTGSQKQLRLEDDMRSGRASPESQEIMLAQDAKVNQQVKEASGEIQTGLGGDFIDVERQMGAAVKEGVQTAQEAGKKVADDAYDEVGDAFLNPEGIKSLYKAMRQSLKGPEFTIDASTTATNNLLKRIGAAESQLKGLEKAGATLKPMHIKQMEVVRKAINGARGTAANATDARNVGKVQSAFDKFQSEAVKNTLFSGDDAALSALIKARSTFSDYAKKYRAQVKKTPSGRKIPDKEGKIIEDMIDADPTDMQVVNWIYGTNKAFGKDTSVKLANKLKSILGEGDNWNAVRQVGFKRFLVTDPGKTTINPVLSVKAFTKAMDLNPELMKSLYSPEEITHMRKFFTHIARTRQGIVKGGANPSGSGTVGIIATKELLGKMSQLLGIGTGNPLLAITGSVMRSSGAGSKGAAEEAIRPFSQIIKAKPALVGTGAAVTGVMSE